MSRRGPEVVVELAIMREKGWLYFINSAGDVVRAPQPPRGEEVDPEKSELVAKTDHTREEGWLYFLDMAGDLARTREAPERTPSPPRPPAEKQDRVEPAPGAYRCLSIRQPWADLILRGIKPIEYRTWKNPYRGPLLLHASTKLEDRDEVRIYYGAEHEFELGGFVGLVDLVDITPHPEKEGVWRWHVENPRRIPFRKAKGKLNLYEVVWPPDSPPEAPLVTDHRTPEDRTPAVEALVSCLPAKTVEELAEGLESVGAGGEREAVAADFRHHYWSLLEQLTDEEMGDAVGALGGKASRSRRKNEKLLLRLLRVVEAEDCRDELLDVGEPEELESPAVPSEAGWVYALGKDRGLYRYPAGDETLEALELVQEAFVPDEEGARYWIVPERQVVVRQPQKTVGAILGGGGG